MNKYNIKDLSENIYEFEELEDAEKRFNEFPNSVKIIQKDSDENEKVIKSRTHKEIGIIVINNKCVYVKVPFFRPSDMQVVKISKIGETPEKLRSKMDVIDERWAN